MGINTGEALTEHRHARSTSTSALVAMPYTLLDQASLHAGMAACVKRGVSVIIGAPFASGILVTGSGGSAHYAYGKALAGDPGEGARHRGGVQARTASACPPPRCSSCSPTPPSSR